MWATVSTVHHPAPELAAGLAEAEQSVFFNNEAEQSVEALGGGRCRL
jgi:hypothetical protein